MPRNEPPPDDRPEFPDDWYDDLARQYGEPSNPPQRTAPPAPARAPARSPAPTRERPTALPPAYDTAPPERTGTALERPRGVPVSPTALGLPRRPVLDAEDAREALEYAAGHGFNVIGPMVQVDYIPQSYRLAFRCIAFDADLRGASSNGLYYDVSDNHNGSRLALHAAALSQIAALAGVEVIARQVVEVERYRWQATCQIRGRMFDGAVRTMIATKDLDLRDGSPNNRKTAWHPSERGRRIETDASADAILQARKHGAAKAETCAFGRAVRALLGIRTLGRDEAARPYVAAVLVYEPDLSDPWVKRALFASEMGVAQLFDRATLDGGRRSIGYVPSSPAPVTSTSSDTAADDGLDEP